MYKKQDDPIFSPAGTNILPRVFFSIKNLTWPPDPSIKEKLIFYLIFELPEVEPRAFSENHNNLST